MAIAITQIKTAIIIVRSNILWEKITIGLLSDTEIEVSSTIGGSAESYGIRPET
ncbi:MAG: hypothetical protein F6K58_25245 [Symploca sp. SIO2E9]|nr:hypothetical protein [Symploca sp. SIO2E9]